MQPQDDKPRMQCPVPRSERKNIWLELSKLGLKYLKQHPDKQRICHFHITGWCEQGSRCTFAHIGKEHLKSPEDFDTAVKYATMVFDQKGHKASPAAKPAPAAAMPAPAAVKPVTTAASFAQAAAMPVVAHQSMPMAAHQSMPMVAHQPMPMVAHQHMPMVAHQPPEEFVEQWEATMIALLERKMQEGMFVRFKSKGDRDSIDEIFSSLFNNIRDVCEQCHTVLSCKPQDLHLIGADQKN